MIENIIEHIGLYFNTISYYFLLAMFTILENY